MLKNYLIIAFRNLWRNKVYSFINIFGLAIGLTSAMLIFLWINDEMSYDQFHQKRNVLYKAWNRAVFDGELHCWNTTPAPLAPTLKKDYPEIKATARYNWVNPRLLTVGKKHLHIEGTEVDPDFLTMFGFPLLQGNPQTALNDVQSIVITESLAKKLFGKQNPMNQVIRIENKDNFKVTGIMKDLPKNTVFKFEYLLPWEYMKKQGWDDPYWGNNSYNTYVELNPNVAIEAVNKKIKNITIKNSGGKEQIEVFLHSIKDWRLYSTFKNGKITGGRIEYVQLFGIIAIFILLIACINFMNLATARSEKRYKEVGIRKVIGATREKLIGQFLGESFLITVLAFFLAIIFTELALPTFNLLTEKTLAIYYSSFTYWLFALIFALAVGLLAGSYPAFYLSSFQPARVLKGTYKSPKSFINPRKILVVLQFTFSIGLIICTIIVFQQLQHAKNREQGYNKENLVYHYFTGSLEKNYELIKKELIEQNIAVSVCKTNHAITHNNSNTWGLSWKGKNPESKIVFDQMTGHSDFSKTFGIQIVEGRDLDMTTFKTDSAACIINQAAKKVMFLKNPIGENIRYDDKDFKIVGIFKDFIWGSPYQPTKPMFIRGGSGWYNVMTFRLSKNLPTSENIKKAEAVFKKYNPYYPFDYQFVDEDYNKKFKMEQLIGTLANMFTILTIIIACLGLFGLSAYTAEQRTKEIGIRKVMGASVFSIVGLLSKDFLRLVIFAFLIASPIAYYLMNQWLKSYQYRIEISMIVFVAAGSVAVLIALLTVSFQAIKASFTNPVEALKYE
jgi:ABC-type antimicrobial peptide transport system permease subunit